MITLRNILVLLLLGLMGPIPSNAAEAIGDWHGLLDTGAGKLTIIISLRADSSGGLTGELQTPDQAPGRKIPIQSVSLSGDRLELDIRALAAAYSADWNRDTGTWQGTWQQSGMSLPLELKSGLPPSRPKVEGLDGQWRASIQRNGSTIRLELSVTTGDDGTRALFAAPDFAIRNLPAVLSRDGTSVAFEVSATGASFTGSLVDDGSAMTGIWRFPGRPDTSVSFHRSAAVQPEASVRPQTPRPPFSYRTETVTISSPVSPGVELAATLTWPEGDGPFPAAVLISGSGPQDRDESLFGHKPFAVLADHLTKNGIAVLRYDDRGFGNSSGRFGEATSWDFATDAMAAVRYLREQSRFHAVGLVGHSEGGVIASIAAKESPEVDFVVLLASPGTDLIEISIWQRRMLMTLQGAQESEIVGSESLIRAIYTRIAAAASREEAAESIRPLLTDEALLALGSPPEHRELVIRQLTNDWHRYLLRYDPRETLAQVHVPVLAMNGILDVQVPAESNLAAIAQSLRHNDDVTVVALKNVNHMFQPAKTGAIGEYADIPETFSVSALDRIAGWINERFQAPVGHAAANQLKPSRPND